MAGTVDYAALEPVIQQCLLDYQGKRLAKLKKLKGKALLRKKNPFLFAASGVETLRDLAEKVLTAYLSSSEETIFGNVFFEPIALKVSGGSATAPAGVDIVIENEKLYKAIAVKSGPSVFNADSKQRQNTNFIKLQSRMSKTPKRLEFVVGYAYGKKKARKSEQFVFREVAGREFWEEISGDPDFYTWIFKRIRDGNKPYAEAYFKSKQETLERLVAELTPDYAHRDGTINWEALLTYNSG